MYNLLLPQADGALKYSVVIFTNRYTSESAWFSRPDFYVYGSIQAQHLTLFEEKNEYASTEADN